MGQSDIAKEFNEQRFINCHAYKSFDEVAKRVMELDQDDELYIKTLNEPVVAEGVDFALLYEGLEKFLQNIFDQPPRRLNGGL